MLGGRDFCYREEADVDPQKTPGEEDVATVPEGQQAAGPERRPGGIESKRDVARRQRRRLSSGRKAADANGKAEQNRGWQHTAPGKVSKNRGREAAEVREKDAKAGGREEVLKKKKAAESAKNTRKYAARKAKERQDRGDATA